MPDISAPVKCPKSMVINGREEEKVLANLDSFIAEDRGGHRLILLRQIWDLFLRLGPTCDATQTAIFDSVLALAAYDIEPGIVLELAAEAKNLPASLPSLTAALTGRAIPPPSETSDVTLDTDDITPLEPGAASALMDNAQEPSAPEQAAAEPAEPAVRVERRAQPRNPVKDATNPITLARKASLEELACIAQLPNLPESLTNVIVARGDRAILILALGNQTATFARSSLTTLAELAPSDRGIREALIARHDLPEPIIERLLPFLSIEKRAALLTNGAQFSEQAARGALAQAQADLVTAYRNGQTPFGLDTCLAMIDDQKMSTNEVILGLAKDVRMAELSALASARLGIREVTTFNILSGRIDHGPAVLLRALDCGAEAIDQVMTMRRRLGCRDSKETRSAFMIAQRYSVGSAQEMLRHMDQVIALPLSTDVEIGGVELSDVDATVRDAA